MDNRIDLIKKAMSGLNPEITIIRKNKKVDLSDLLNMSASGLLKCVVTIKDHPVNFSEVVIPGTYFDSKPKIGIGYQYRNVCAAASVETDKETAIRLIGSAYGTSQCFRPDGSVII